jgi:hypothetical protein
MLKVQGFGSMFEYNYGVHLKDSAIWFDADKKKRLCFISSALSTNFLKHEKVITTPQTHKLIHTKFNNVDILPCPYNHVFNLGEIEVELLPSGYILGSCQVLLYKENIKILYVGDFKLDILSTSVPLEITECDQLIIKSTYGIKKYVFPSIEIAMIPIIEFINECLEKDLVPILVADMLGNAQELVYILGEKGYDLYVHDSIRKVNRIYEEFGFLFPRYKRLNKIQDMISGVIIIPDEYRAVKKLSVIQNAVYASISEMAVNVDYVNYSTNSGYAFPLSVRSGYDEMIKFVELVNPKQIYVTGSHNVEFSADLKKRGYNSLALNHPEQLGLI